MHTLISIYLGHNTSGKLVYVYICRGVVCFYCSIFCGIFSLSPLTPELKERIHAMQCSWETLRAQTVLCWRCWLIIMLTYSPNALSISHFVPCHFSLITFPSEWAGKQSSLNPLLSICCPVSPCFLLTPVRQIMKCDHSSALALALLGCASLGLPIVLPTQSDQVGYSHFGYLSRNGHSYALSLETFLEIMTPNHSKNKIASGAFMPVVERAVWDGDGSKWERQREMGEDEDMTAEWDWNQTWLTA